MLLVQRQGLLSKNGEQLHKMPTMYGNQLGAKLDKGGEREYGGTKVSGLFRQRCDFKGTK